MSSEVYEAARAEVAGFVRARADDYVIFTRNTTDSMSLLASALPRRTQVFAFATEHHASLLPWDRKATTWLPVPLTAADAQALLSDALRTSSAQGPTLVVISGASNVTGEYWPIEDLTRVAHDHGARVVVDAAQLLAHRRIDLRACGADYVAFSGHKIYAPYGAGALVGRGDWLDAAQPYLRGGGASETVANRDVKWKAGPARHEGGTPNVLGAVAVAAACATLSRHQEQLREHETELGERLRREISGIAGVHTYSIFGDDAARAPVVAFTIDGIDSDLVSAALSAEFGIGVRDGKFCAHPLVDHLLADADAASAVRVSAGLGTTHEHVDRLVAGIVRLAGQGPRARYTRDADLGWVVEDDAREHPIPLPW